jgi:hypothetical protein
MHWKNRFKVLGTLLVALVAALAVSASAAQATTWTMKQNAESLLHMEVSGFFALGEIRTNNGTIHCNTGLWGSVLVELNSDHSVATMLVHGAFSGCGYLGGAEKTCTVSSPGAKAGEIIIKETGPLSLKGETILATVEGSNTITATGALCPFPKEQVLSGSMTFTMPGVQTEAAAHSVELNEGKLLLGKEEAFLDGKEKGPIITGEIKGKEGAKFSISGK